MNNIKVRILLPLILIVMSSQALAGGVSFDLLRSTPVGSWQLREEIDTNAKGKQTGTTIRTALVGKESRGGQTHYWLEMEIDSFKITRKGKRKKKGSRLIVKSLVSESVLKGDPANVMKNLQGIGVETIIQSGKDKPMRLRNTGDMMAGIAQAANIQIQYDFNDLGRETVDVAAGSFESKKIQGKGNVDTKVLFKKIKIQSDATMWLSDKVPFGTVKIDGMTLTNGKKSTQSSQLLEFGMSGAQSKITGEIEDAPELPGLGDLLGG